MFGIIKKVKELEVSLDCIIGKMTTILFICNQIKENKISGLSAEIIKPVLEAKWQEEKNRKGKIILNKGALIIEERTRLHNEILTEERQGKNVDKLKERLIAFDWVVENVK